MTLKNAIFTSSGVPRDFRRRKIDSAPSRAPESGRIWAALTRKPEPYGESQLTSVTTPTCNRTIRYDGGNA